jgi:hypothetical protein
LARFANLASFASDVAAPAILRVRVEVLDATDFADLAADARACVAGGAAFAAVFGIAVAVEFRARAGSDPARPLHAALCVDAYSGAVCALAAHVVVATIEWIVNLDAALIATFFVRGAGRRLHNGCGIAHTGEQGARERQTD